MADALTPTGDARIVVPPNLKATLSALLSRPLCTVSNPQGKTLLCAAVLSGHLALLDLLLGLGVDPNSCDECDDRLVSALHLACESGRAEMVARLLRAGADPNRQVESLGPSRRERDAGSSAPVAVAWLPGRTALHVAIERQQVDCVCELLRALPSKQRFSSASAPSPSSSDSSMASGAPADQPDASATASASASGNAVTSAPSSDKTPLPLNLNNPDANENTALHEAVLRLRESLGTVFLASFLPYRSWSAFSATKLHVIVYRASYSTRTRVLYTRLVSVALRVFYHCSSFPKNEEHL